MSEQLTAFERYIQLRLESELDIDNDNDVIGLMDSLQEVYQAEYDEINDLVCNALDISERASAIYNQSQQAQDIEDARVVAAVIRKFIEEAMREVEYKLLDQREIDGSYQAKQDAEMNRAEL